MKLIINADDFGLSKSITDGIICGIRGGYITSTTIMVNMEFAQYAVEKAIENNIQCVGLHVNLTVGKPIIPNPVLTDENGVFLYNRKQIENPFITYEDVYAEVSAQIEQFRKLCGDRLKLDHLDYHHAILQNEAIRRAIFDIAKQHNLPMRNGIRDFQLNQNECDGVKMPDILVSDFTIKNVSLEKIGSIVEQFRQKDVVVEIMTHPGWIDEHTKSLTSYVGRDKELDVLKQAKGKGVFQGVQLVSFAKV